ncbi:MAG: hypothetical protein PHD95_03630 [Candidatus ainarchaeum sp.]|nr:hypothetical protein [Candidatus ainarchaeum sp.]
MPEPIRKRRFVQGQDKPFDPNVHLDLRFVSRRKRQLGELVGGDLVLSKSEVARLNKPRPYVIPSFNKPGHVEFVNRRRYPILSKGRRKEDREFSD